MDAQNLYEEWKELIALEKLVKLKKKELKQELQHLKGQYLPIRSTESLGREIKMAEMYKEGKTMQEIGDMYGMSRERVRQLVRKVGVSGKSLGRYNQKQEGKQ